MKAPTPEEMECKIAAAEAELPELMAAADRADQAAAEDSFSGWLRRQVYEWPKTSLALEEAAGLSSVDLANFLEGVAPLTTAQVDRLLRALAVHLPTGGEAAAAQ